ncbi:MAG: NAD(P)-dependent alcohol dehydrogenase [Pseudomonadota bacterium]
MKTFQLHPQIVGADALHLVNKDKPVLRDGEVLVKMRAASLNYRDLVVARQTNREQPRVPLSDGAGDIVDRHPSATRFNINDRVIPFFYPDWIEGSPSAKKQQRALGGSIDGVLTEYLAVHETALAKMPEHLTYAEAATLPCAGVTAWHALFERSPIVPGSTVSMLGTGGLSTFALQFAKAAGARVAVVSGSEEKWAEARSRGADYLVNYKTTPEWSKKLLDWTNGEGVQNVLDAGGPRTLDQSLAAARVGGNVSVMGILGGVEGAVGPMPILLKQLNVRGIYVGSGEMLSRLTQFLAVNKIHPVINSMFAFDDAPQAYLALEKAQHVGKIVISFD